MTVTLDVRNSSVFNLLRDLAALDFIRLDSPIPAAEPSEAEVDAALAAGEPCPLCAIYHEPNAKTIAAIEEADAIVRGEIPSPDYASFEAFLADLKS